VCIRNRQPKEEQEREKRGGGFVILKSNSDKKEGGGGGRFPIDCRVVFSSLSRCHSLFFFLILFLERLI
jgi:hypothetical protein